MDTMDPSASPEQAPTAPTASTAPTAASQLDPEQDFSAFVPPNEHKDAWAELGRSVDRVEAAQVNAKQALMFGDTPEIANTRRRKVRVISQAQTSLNTFSGGGIPGTPSMAPPVEETLAYDIRPGENEDQAFQRAMEAYRATDAGAEAANLEHTVEATRYQASRSVSQVTLGGSSVMPGIGTQDFERRYLAKHPNDATALEIAAAGPAMEMTGVKGLAGALPINWVFSGVARLARPLRSVMMKGMLTAGDGLKDVPMAWDQSLGNFMASHVGREYYQYVRPATLDAFHEAWTAVGATAKDNIIRIAEEQAGNLAFLTKMRAWKAELTAAGVNLRTFRVVKTAVGAVAGAAAGGLDASVRAAWSNTSGAREHAYQSILPMMTGGGVVGGLFSAAESLYNAAATPKFKKPPHERYPIDQPLELKQMRARQLERHLKDLEQ